MSELLNKYVKNEFGEIDIPQGNEEKVKLARELFGYSIVNNLDYWISIVKDYVENQEPKVPFVRKNEAYKKDKYFREAFSGLDSELKTKIFKLVNEIATGITFGILTSIDQNDFGELSLTFKPKAKNGTEEIKLTSEREDLHDELFEWIYSFSKFKDELVIKQENNSASNYRLR